jgi:hypothetical protein
VFAQQYCEYCPFTQRSCKLCGGSFTVARKVGHPREYCLSCQPDGYSVVRRADGRVKLRRRIPVVARADLELIWGKKGNGK